MKKLITFVFFSFALFTSCEEDLVIFDNVGGKSIGTFQSQSPALLTYNPAADTDNIYTVSVSTVSDVDRAVSVSVDDASTISSDSYSINTSTVIPAGSFSADIVVTTFASDVFPENGSTLILNLDSVVGAEIISGTSVAVYNIGFTVECPSVDISGVLGDGANVLANEILTGGFGAPLSAGGLTRTIEEGPGENQITIIGGVGFNSSEDLVLNINPVNGSVSYGGPEGAVFFFNGPNPISYTEVNGRVLTCIGLIELEIAAPFGSPFDFNSFNLQF